MAGYLHLTWYRYGGGHFDVFSYAKRNIEQEYIRRRSKYLQGKQAVDKLQVEDAYNMAAELEKVLNGNFGDAENAIKSEEHQLLGEIDQLVEQLPKKVGEITKLKDYAVQINRTVELLQTIVNKGQGGTVEVGKIQTVLTDAKRLQHALGFKNGYTRNSDRELLVSLRRNLQTNVAGAAFEIFSTLGLASAHSFGLKNVSVKNVVHTGAGVNVKAISDPNLEAAIKKMQNAGADLSKEPFADILLEYQITDGNGRGSVTTLYEGIQLKNYSDIEKIGLGAKFDDKTLGHITSDNYSILKAFGNREDTLVNAAAALGNNIVGNGAVVKVVKGIGGTVTQGTLAAEWNSVVQAAQKLAAIDSFMTSLGVLDNVSYFAVRGKQEGGAIRVFSVAEILLNADKAITGYSGNVPQRYMYSDINKAGFEGDRERDPKLGEIRSENVVGGILAKINATKINIALNAGMWFN